MCTKSLKLDSSKDLKDDICQKFVPIIVITVVLSGVILIAISAIINTVASDYSKTTAIDQATRHGMALSQESARLLDIQLTGLSEGSVSFTANAANNMHSYTPYSQGNIASYFDPEPPLATDPRQLTPVSFGHSTFHFPGTTAATEFTETQMGLVNESAHLDNFFPTIYQDYSSMKQTYVGYTDSSLFRIYPGNETETSYDPTLRPWFTDAQNEGGLIVTSPYVGASAKKWMITIADTFNLGVAATDVIIDVIQKNINSLFLFGGKVSLIQDDGIVIADVEWDTSDISNENPFTTNDLSDPPITSGDWDTVKSIGAGESIIVNFTHSDFNYRIMATRLTQFSQYLTVVTISETEIVSTLTDILDQVRENGNLSIGIICAAICVSIAISLGLILDTTMRLAKQSDRSKENITNYAKSLGRHNSEIKHFQTINDGLGEESNNLNAAQNRFYQMAEKTRDQSRQEATEVNPFYSDKANDMFHVGQPSQAFAPDQIPMAQYADPGLQQPIYPPQQVVNPTDTQEESGKHRSRQQPTLPPPPPFSSEDDEEAKHNGIQMVDMEGGGKHGGRGF